MPVLKIKHVVSCSSEDEKHPSDNITKPETYYKWRCATGGEANATIVLQLEKATQISGVDIGNNGSAFIEVLVGRSSWSKSEEFQVLLVASSFMTPVDSKAGKEISRVRMFGLEHLNKPVTAEKWDQVKIVCTQPYNQNEPYGLSFVKLYTPVDESETSKEKSVNLGRFKLKCDDDEIPTLSSGSFFQKRMNIPVESAVVPKMSMAASARSSDPSPRTNTIFKTNIDKTITCAKKISVSEDKRQEVASALFQGAENKPKKGHTFNSSTTPDTKKNTEVTSKRKIENESKSPHVSGTPPPPSKKLKDISSPQVSNTPPSKKLKDIPKHTKVKIKKKNVSYGKILEGVIFALSGYQNPERGNIRDLALAMGARYEPSWSDRCTHLICAFANTPKFREVIGKGKIVRKKWIDECDKNNRRMNTKNYRLDGGGDSSFESSGSDEEKVDTTNNGKNNEGTAQKDNRDKKKSSSECDTEDEIEKIRMLEKKELEKENSTTPSYADNKLDADDAYGASTDDDAEAEDVSDRLQVPSMKAASSDLPSMKSFFENKLFLLYGDFDVKDTRLLKRYITDHSGSVADYMTDTVNFVISKENWDQNFQQAFDDNSSLVFIQPKWIFKCHEKQDFVPYDNYEIKPPSP